jgi:hypothetical protein
MLYVGCMIAIGIVIGYFLDRMERRYKAKRRMDLAEKFVDDMEMRQNIKESNDEKRK